MLCFARNRFALSSALSPPCFALLLTPFAVIHLYLLCRDKKTVQDKYGFVVEVPVAVTEPQEEGLARGLKQMWNTVLKPNPALWGELDRLSAEDMLRHRSLKSLIRECGIPEPLRKKVRPSALSFRPPFCLQ